MANVTETRDYGIRQLVNMEVRLREDLSFTYQQFAGRACYLIEDRINSRFYRIGVAEYTFISLLDGNRVSEAMAAAAALLGRDAFTEADVAAICRWLIQSQLAYTDESAQADRLFAEATADGKRRKRARFNPIIIKIPLVNPDRLLDALLPWCSWLVSWPAVVVWLLVLLCGAWQIVAQPDRFAAAASGVLAPGNLVALGAAWLVLKVIHEFFHALVCKKYGGNVLEGGMVLILFAPVAYVDVTAAWRLGSKWQRLYISAAGMYAELFCAALAALVWSSTDPGVVNYVAYNVVIMAGVSTLLFNGNPLMRFDGYYILADTLEIPNLYWRGQQFLMYTARRYLLGLDAEAPRWPRGKATVIKVYGVLAFVWRMLVSISLIVAAQALFYGAGLLLAIAGVALWYGIPLVRFVKYLIGGNTTEKPNLKRFFAVGGAISLSVLIFFGVVPWPAVVTAPAVVDYASLEIVRAESPGFLSEVRVRTGQYVEAGEVLARMVNQELAMEVEDLELAIEESLLRDHRYQQQERLAAAHIEARFRKVLEKRRDEKMQQWERLTIRAPVSGHVIGRRLDRLPGRFVEPGTEILTIAHNLTKELKISIEQDDVDLFTRRVGSLLSVRLWCAPTHRMRGRLTWIDPQARRDVLHAALAATSGGPLAVREVMAENAAQSKYELVTPRIDGTVVLVDPLPDGLRAGQRASVRFRSHHETIGGHLYRILRDWVRARSGRILVYSTTHSKDTLSAVARAATSPVAVTSATRAQGNALPIPVAQQLPVARRTNGLHRETGTSRDGWEIHDKSHAKSM